MVMEEIEKEQALAELLLNEVVFLNSFWWMHDKFVYDAETKENKTVPMENPRWTKDESEFIAIAAICNDVFMWGCADAEPVKYNQILPLYKMWKEDKDWGPVKWACIQRNMQPQKPMIRQMKAASVWDSVMESLEKNDD